MISRELRPRIAVLTAPAARLLARAGVSAGALTLAGLVLSAVSALFYALGSVRTAGLFLLLAGFGDLLDGALARAAKTATRFGAFLDSVCDRYAELFVFLGILFHFHLARDARSVLLTYAALLGSLMVSYTRARAESIIGECQVGLMERPERIVVLIAGSLVDLLIPALWIVAVGANVTALQRIAHTRRKIKEKEAERR